jgi:hypothetical protein
MKWFATLLILALVSCSNPEADKLRLENAQLKSQLEKAVQERDALKTQIESVRSALGQGSSSMPSSGTGSSDSTSNDSSSSSTNSSDSSSSPTSPNDSSSSNSSSSDTGTPTTPITPLSNPQPSPAVLAYAQDVLKVAATYGAETGTPPTDCAKGYEAGSSRLLLSQGIALKSCAVETVSNQLRVTLETIDGAKLTLPSNGP